MGKNPLLKEIKKQIKIKQEKIYGKNLDSVKTIQFRLGYLLQEIVKQDMKNGVVLSSVATQRIVNIATVFILQCWLEKDTNARQTINSFSKKKYLSVSETQRASNGYAEMANEAQKQSYIRAAKVYDCLQIATHRQMYEEQGVSRRGSYNVNTGEKRDFLSLRFIDLYASGYLDLIKLLVYRKDVLGTNPLGDQINIFSGYQQYAKIFFRYSTDGKQ